MNHDTMKLGLFIDPHPSTPDLNVLHFRWKDELGRIQEMQTTIVLTWNAYAACSMLSSFAEALFTKAKEVTQEEKEGGK